MFINERQLYLLLKTFQVNFPLFRTQTNKKSLPLLLATTNCSRRGGIMTVAKLICSHGVMKAFSLEIFTFKHVNVQKIIFDFLS